MRTELSAEYVRECLDYSCETGDFHWRKRPAHHFVTQRYCDAWNSRFAGKKTGRSRSDGRIDLCINDAKWRAHRIAWLIMNGRWPICAIDHIDGNAKNNSINNLRECTLSQNQYNRRVARNNTTGFKGVAWIKNRRKFRAAIRILGKQTHIGLYDTAHEAHEAYCVAAAAHHGEFARTGTHGEMQ